MKNTSLLTKALISVTLAGLLIQAPAQTTTSSSQTTKTKQTAKSDSAESFSSVKGSVMVRERMALPEDAVLSVWIEDVSKADAPAELISKTTMLLKGRQGTFNFVIPYRVKDISKSNSYSVRATIEHNGKLMFTSTSSNPVITKGSKKSASFTLERVGDHSNVTLSAFGNDWTLKEMNGKALGEKDSKVSLTLNEGDKNCNGRSFVNGYGGSIVFSGSGQAGSIKMGSIMSTKMAGSSESMKHETEYFSTLNKVDSFVIHGSELHLKSGSKVVLKFVTGK